MVKLKKLPRPIEITRLTSVEDYDKCHYTRYRVTVAGKKHYNILVDSGGLWTCDCKSSKFRGDCYHIAVLQTEFQREILLNRLKPIEVALVSSRDFDNYLNQDRFIAERQYRGEPLYLVFGYHLYLQNKRIPQWQFQGYHRFAGTILEGRWEKRPGVGNFYLYDCPYFKGQDLTRTPLAERREKLEVVVPKFVAPEVKISPYEYTVAGKKALEKEYGCILKDVTSYYDLTYQSVRAWLARRHQG